MAAYQPAVIECNRTVTLGEGDGRHFGVSVPTSTGKFDFPGPGQSNQFARYRQSPDSVSGLMLSYERLPGFGTKHGRNNAECWSCAVSDFAPLVYRFLDSGNKPWADSWLCPVAC